MEPWPAIVNAFPLRTIEMVTQRYRQLPDDSHVYYHYTTHDGLEGILKRGGLRASYRRNMNDPGEFAYAKAIVDDALNEIDECSDLLPVAESIVEYTRRNLKHFLTDSPEKDRSYCACLTTFPDDPGQWEEYAEKGEGFAIGFNMVQSMEERTSAIKRGLPFSYCGPVIYDEQAQHRLVTDLVRAGIRDWEMFAERCSQDSLALTALRNRVTKEIVTQLLVLIDFIKDPKYRNERELRLILDSNDGTLLARDIRHYERNNALVPYLFIDFRSPATGHLCLEEIKVGPKGPFAEREKCVEDLLDELGYGSTHDDRPRVTRSSA